MEKAEEIFWPGFEASSTVLAWTHEEALPKLFIVDTKANMSATVDEFTDLDDEDLTSEEWGAVVEETIDYVIYALDISGAHHMIINFGEGSE